MIFYDVGTVFIFQYGRGADGYGHNIFWLFYIRCKYDILVHLDDFLRYFFVGAVFLDNFKRF